MKRPLEGCNVQAGSKVPRPEVLLVDEDVNDLEYYSGMLCDVGCGVREVSSYSRAASLLASHQFDLVLVEQGSANFEGRAVLAFAVKVRPRVTVMLFTRIVDVDCCLEALNVGACEYVQKPLTSAELRDLIGDYLEVPMNTFPAGQNYLLRHHPVERGKKRATFNFQHGAR